MCLGSVCLISLFLIWGTVCKPRFFWTSTQVLTIRQQFGDKGAEIFYCSIGGSLLFLAWVYYNSNETWVWWVALLILVACVVYLISPFTFAGKSRRSEQRRRKASVKQGFTEKFQDKLEQWRCAPLKRELLRRFRPDTAERLIRLAKLEHPGKPEYWYLEKVLYDVKRGR